MTDILPSESSKDEMDSLFEFYKTTRAFIKGFQGQKMTYSQYRFLSIYIHQIDEYDRLNPSFFFRWLDECQGIDIQETQIDQ